MNLTPEDIEGPYYRENPPARRQFSPDEFVLSGRVFDHNGNAISNARIDFWHANEFGAYDTDSDEMQYYGQLETDSEGDYDLISIVPGRYLDGNLYRPAHIHAKIWVNGVVVLTTQLYFKDDPYNETDRFFKPELIMDYYDDQHWFDFVVEVGR